MIKLGKVNVVIGGQWGSEGKGKLYGYLYEQFPEIDIAVCDFTPNAGHTYVDRKGAKFISKVLPLGYLFDSVKVCLIGPHAVIDVNRLLEEMETLRRRNISPKVFIHPMASIVTDESKRHEALVLTHIASTMQGSASAQMSKIMRNNDPIDGARLAGDEPALRHLLGDTQDMMQHYLNCEKHTVLVETCQGFDLGLNHGTKWPYTTGRDCLIGRVLDNAGVSPKRLGSIIVALRTYPIRVGSIEGGYSGPYYSDQREVTWEYISKIIGILTMEMTTVTKRVRRVFTWSNTQVQRMCNFIEPDYAFINFLNYIPEGERDIWMANVSSMLAGYGCDASLFGTGALPDDMIVK